MKKLVSSLTRIFIAGNLVLFSVACGRVSNSDARLLDIPSRDTDVADLRRQFEYADDIVANDRLELSMILQEDHLWSVELYVATPDMPSGSGFNGTATFLDASSSNAPAFDLSMQLQDQEDIFKFGQFTQLAERLVSHYASSDGCGTHKVVLRQITMTSLVLERSYKERKDAPEECRNVVEGEPSIAYPDRIAENYALFNLIESN